MIKNIYRIAKFGDTALNVQLIQTFRSAVTELPSFGFELQRDCNNRPIG
jgi:hypothetical protein